MFVMSTYVCVTHFARTGSEKFPACKRKNLTCALTQFSKIRLCQCWLIGKSDALTLSVNKAVLFYGVRMFGDSRRSQYEVNFKIKDENVTGTYTSQQDGDGVLGYVVMLTKPISFLPDEEFTITMTINGRDSCWGTARKRSVKIDDIVVTFKDEPSYLSGNLTNQTEGQFCKVFLSEL